MLGQGKAQGMVPAIVGNHTAVGCTAEGNKVGQTRQQAPKNSPRISTQASEYRANASIKKTKETKSNSNYRYQT